MASAYRRDIACTIRNNMKRFVSIAVICALGVAMFTGLRASCEDLRASADGFFDGQRLFDVQVLSTLGLDEGDIEALAGVEGVESVEGGFTEATYTEVAGERASVDVKALSDTGFNEPYLLSGELPEQPDEVAVSQAFLDESGLSLGDTVELDPAENEDEAVFARHPYTIVGTVIDPANVNNPQLSFRSTSGSDYTFVVAPGAVTSDTCTVAYISIEGAAELACYSDAYRERVDAVTARIEDEVRADREQARTDSVKGDAQAELDEARAEYEDERADAESELADAKSQLDSAVAELASGQAQVDDGWAGIAAGEKSLDEVQAQLDEGRAGYEQAMATRSELAGQLDTAQQGLAAYDGLAAQLEQVEGCIAAIENGEGSPECGSASLDELEQRQAQLQAAMSALLAKAGMGSREELAGAIAQLEAGIAAIDEQTAGLSSQYFNEQQAVIDASRSDLDAAKAQLVAAQGELDQGRAEYEDGLAEYEEGARDAEEGFADAEAELADAQADIDAIEAASWYVQDRTSLSSYSSIESDADSIEAIGTLFPAVFLVVAVLVALTTITRMVEEERGLIGTYKALGYRNREIYAKYLVYAFAACAVGCVAGFLLGFVALPLFIFAIFDIMYVLPSYPILFDVVYGFGGVAIFLVAIVGTAGVACRSEVRQTPAALMRPKAPKSGSRIFLERIPFLWKRMTFLGKVTARNLFRYKRRFLMTVAGIMGCTALIVCGFIIRDSVATLIPEQYGEITRYDIMAVTDEGDLSQVADELEADERVGELARIRLDSVTLGAAGGEETVQLVVVPDGVELSDYLGMEDKGTGEELTLPAEGALVTQNAAEVLGFSAGDTVSVQDSELERADVEVAAVVRNYLGNYVFMSEGAYGQVFGAFEPNGVLVRVSDACEDEIAFADELSRDNRLLSVTATEELAHGFDKSFALINGVVVIVLGMAAALAFTVLFTLSTTNISERERELATIKVLGFRAPEVHHYVNKETLILTGVGILVGLPCGYVLGDVLLQSLKMPSISFVTTISPVSYAIAAVLPFVFALAVNLITNRTLNRIDMISALKSVE